jgi:hypothetical protein
MVDREEVVVRTRFDDGTASPGESLDKLGGVLILVFVGTREVFARESQVNSVEKT